MLMIIYYYKLKNNVKNEFMCDRHIFNNLKKLITAAIKINNKLYK